MKVSIPWMRASFGLVSVPFAHTTVALLVDLSYSMALRGTWGAAPADGLEPQAGDLIVLAARPSMGKTALALNIGEHVAVKEGLPVVVFSMEMGASQLAYFAAVLRVPRAGRAEQDAPVAGIGRIGIAVLAAQFQRRRVALAEK